MIGIRRPQAASWLAGHAAMYLLNKEPICLIFSVVTIHSPDLSGSKHGLARGSSRGTETCSEAKKMPMHCLLRVRR